MSADRPRMNATPSDRSGAWMLAVGGALLGPGAAVLRETGTLSLGPSATLWPVFGVALAAAAGLWIVKGATKGSAAWARVVTAVPNALVLGLYGFLLAFFGLGGSR